MKDSCLASLITIRLQQQKEQQTEQLQPYKLTVKKQHGKYIKYIHFSNKNETYTVHNVMGGQHNLLNVYTILSNIRQVLSKFLDCIAL